MRTTNEIIIAVKESQPVTAEELRMALLALNGIEHFTRQDLDRLIEAVDTGDFRQVKLRAVFAKSNRERMFQAVKTDPVKWLGPANIPGNPEYEQRMQWAKNLFEKATGEKL